MWCHQACKRFENVYRFHEFIISWLKHRQLTMFLEKARSCSPVTASLSISSLKRLHNLLVRKVHLNLHFTKFFQLSRLLINQFERVTFRKLKHNQAGSLLQFVYQWLHLLHTLSLPIMPRHIFTSFNRKNSLILVRR